MHETQFRPSFQPNFYRRLPHPVLVHPALTWPLLSLLSGSSPPEPPPDKLPADEQLLQEQLLHETFLQEQTPDVQTKEGLNDILNNHIRQLGVSAFEALIAGLLQAAGYEQVRVMRDPRRKRRSHKGRNRHGGVDIIAKSRSGLATDAVLVQVKQYERPVSRRFVDELRGALLRTQSRHALLITTSHFSPAALKAAKKDHIAPVHLMDGNSLCDLLIQHQIGVQHDGHNHPQIDHDFFQRLKQKHPNASTKTSTITPHQNAAPSGNANAETKQLSDSLTGNLVEKGGEMMGRTHALIGITTLWLLKPFELMTPDNLAPLVLLAVLGALAPDLDASESKLKRFAVAGIMPFAPLSHVLHQSFGHRGLLHSLAGLGLFTILCSLPLALWLGGPFGIALSLGYASHLLADSATKSGVPLLYPKRKRYHLLPRGWRLTTGSMAEEMLLPFLAFAILLLLFKHLALIS